MIKAIVFDFGRVILDLSKKQSLSAPQALSILFEIPIEEAVELWRHNRTNLVTGKETPREFLERVGKKNNSNKSTDKMLSEWTILNSKSKELINWDLMTLIEKLKQQFKVYVLSDAAGVTQDDAFTKEIESKFDGFFVSYREGYQKPDKEAFQNFLHKTNLQAEECIFIDDTEVNVKAAGALGFKSFQYVTLEQLKEDFRSLGIN